MLSAIKNIFIGVLVGLVATGLIGMAFYFSATSTQSQAAAPAPAPSMVATGAISIEIVSTSTPLPPTATETPTVTPTASFTPIPTLDTLQYVSPTITPSITPTVDAVQAALNSGDLVFAGPLSNEQQIALYKASLYFSQTTPADSRRVAVQINGVGYGDPTNICGPLAIAVLRDAGLMRLDITPHDFWLLDPLAATGAQLLKKAFPADQYVHAIVPTALNKVDWRATPLLPGDFLFIWHGSWGNFDHMLVVNRVDANQRAYAVTNYGTDAGYIISEAMLYDPNDPSQGLFHQWTRERDQILGSTGFGGYELWRHKSP